MRTLKISISNVIVSLTLFKEVYVTHLTRSSKQLHEPQKRRTISTGNLRLELKSIAPGEEEQEMGKGAAEMSG